MNARHEETKPSVQALYSIPQLARWTRLSPQSIHRMLQRYQVETLRIGRCHLVPISEIEKKIRPLWESMQTCESLRLVAGM